MTQKTEAQFLREMVAVIERDGWHQGSFKGRDGSRCVLGAASVVVSESTDAIRTWALIAPRLRDLTGGRIAEWQDAPERTVEEVLALLHNAADDAAREQLALVPAREAVGV